jgi:hypothetical protein
VLQDGKTHIDLFFMNAVTMVLVIAFLSTGAQSEDVRNPRGCSGIDDGHLPMNTPALLGGDFNTWFRESKEPAIRYVEKSFDRPSTAPKHGTVKPGYGLSEQMVGYMFFRVPNNWHREYRCVNNRYGSDHYPLLGRLVMKDRCIKRFLSP